MNRMILTISLLAISSVAVADSNPIETVDQARQRQSAENYQQHQQQDNRLVPPTYQQPLGSPTVQGVDRPGYNSGYQGNASQPSYGGGSWQNRAKGR